MSGDLQAKRRQKNRLKKKMDLQVSQYYNKFILHEALIKGDS